MRSLSLTLACAGLAVALASPARAADPTRFLPAETEQVVWLNVRQTLDSEIVKKHLLETIKTALDTDAAKTALKVVALDPLKDLDEVVMGMWGDTPENMNLVAVVAGRFDGKKLVAAAEEVAKQSGDKVAVLKEGDHTLIKVTVENRPDPIFLSVADDKTILLGTKKPLLLAALKTAGDAKPVLKKELAALLKDRDQKASLSAVSTSDGKVTPIPPNPLFDNPEQLTKQLEKMRSSRATVRLSADVTVEVALGMTDADAAGDFNKTVDGLLTKAKAFLPFITMQNANLKPVVADVTESLKTESKAKDVVIKLKVTADALRKAFGGE